MGWFSDRCPFCDARAVFDAFYDLNMCYHCGAQETVKGWMRPGARDTTIWFTYSFDCPLCRKTISSGNNPASAFSRDYIPRVVYNQHRTCPYCKKPYPYQALKLSIQEST